MTIVLTEFALGRLFRERRRNTIQDVTPEAFERHLNEVPPLRVVDGYAPFCKLHVHRNWTSTRCLAVPIIHQKGRNRVCAAALAIQAPVTRMSQAEMIKKIPLLQNAAKAMSATISADVGAA